MPHRNEWQYVFSGVLLDRRPDAILITATVELKDTTYLYVGFLRDYAFTRDGELHRLSVELPLRRQLSADRQRNDADVPHMSGRYYEIESDEFFIWCRDVKTLGVSYVYWAEEGELEEDSAVADAPTDSASEPRG
jgi:hypothetical protein